ncbi:MAG: hypothetical protein ACJ8M1_13235 [Chthoniobacterales bacterium]
MAKRILMVVLLTGLQWNACIIGRVLVIVIVLDDPWRFGEPPLPTAKSGWGQ